MELSSYINIFSEYYNKYPELITIIKNYISSNQIDNDSINLLKKYSNLDELYTIFNSDPNLISRIEKSYSKKLNSIKYEYNQFLIYLKDNDLSDIEWKEHFLVYAINNHPDYNYTIDKIESIKLIKYFIDLYQKYFIKECISSDVSEIPIA
jgi:hypothetical protein